MAQFSNCAQHNKWNRAEKLAYLRNSLDADAANILWDYGKEVTESLTGLTKILESRFGGKANAKKHRIELRSRRRRRDESLQSLHSDIRRLAALAYPNVEPQTRDVIIGDYFLDALGDPDFALKVRERQPEDLDAALRVASQLEVLGADAMRLKEGPKLERGEGKRVREISSKKPNGEVNQKKLEEKMEERMEAKFAEFEGRIPAASNNGGYRGKYRQSGSSRHTAPNSYNGAQPPRNGRFPMNSRGPNPGSHPNNFVGPLMNYGVNGNFYQLPNSFAGCFGCGDPSHRMRECPRYSAKQQQLMLQQQGIPQQQPPPQQPPATQQPPDVRPVKDPSEKKDKTCIWVKYRQHKISALIDTGSDVSISGEDVARKLGWTVHKHQIKTVCVANNEVMSVRGAAYVTLAVAGEELS